jgi:putative methylase
MMPKNKLSILLSKLKDFDEPSAKLEQYSTPGDIAADIVWNAFMSGDIEGKEIIDAACGPGILGIGALVLGATKVYFIDKSEKALALCKKNICFAEHELSVRHNAELIQGEISHVNIKADVVIQNPPFGTKEKHADREFLLKAFDCAPVVYSLHKLTTSNFVEAIARDNGFRITHLYKYDFPLRATQKFHVKPVKKIRVGCWRFRR